MADVNLGVGHQKSVRDVVAIAEKEVRRTNGAARTITVSTPAVVIEANRDEFGQPFTHYSIAYHDLNGKLPEKLQAIVDQNSELVRTAEDSPTTILVDGEFDAIAPVLESIAGAHRLPEVWLVEGSRYNLDPIRTELIFKAMVQYKASDCHIAAGEAPVFRVDGEMHRSEVMGEVSSPQILALLREMATERYWKEFHDHHQTSFNFHQVGLGYSRVSAFVKSGAPHITIRFLPENIPSFDDLHIPSETMIELAKLHHGLVLITGMTGSGKSTTVAALIDWINSNRSAHILCIENPIEYVHRNKKSIISQRSTGLDVDDFGSAAHGALRHDPDVIVIGEMRDPDTIRSAISAAATGHLVISTLHSNTAYETINRIVSFFDPVERDLVRLQLCDAVRCVICQRLVPREGGGRQPALEILLNDVKAITDGILTGSSMGVRIGMQQTTSHSFIFEDYLYKLLKKGTISLETATHFSTDPSILEQMRMGTYTIPRLDSIKHLHTE